MGRHDAVRLHGSSHPDISEKQLQGDRRMCTNQAPSIHVCKRKPLRQNIATDQCSLDAHESADDRRRHAGPVPARRTPLSIQAIPFLCHTTSRHPFHADLRFRFLKSDPPQNVLIVCPVIYSPSSETRNETSFATSSGSWMRPSLMSCLTRFALASPTEIPS